MILKVERYNDDSNCSNHWWMLDDIRKLSHRTYKNLPFNGEFIEIDSDISLLDYEKYLISQGREQSHRDIIQLVCRLSNGNEFVVLFDTLGYILNDNGKTIEKLVANYR